MATAATAKAMAPNSGDQLGLARTEGFTSLGFGGRYAFKLVSFLFFLKKKIRPFTACFPTKRPALSKRSRGA